MNCTIFVLSLVLGFIYNCHGFSLYGVTVGSNGDIDTVAVNNSTGNFSILATQKQIEQTFFPMMSCFDPQKQIFYYASSKFIYAVDVTKKKLHEIPFSAYTVTSMRWDPLTSQLLIAMESWAEFYFVLMHYPISGGAPTMLANLTALGIGGYGIESAEAFDPTSRIFFIASSTGNPHSFLIQQVNLNNPINASRAEYACGKYVMWMTYDPVKEMILGLAANITDQNLDIYGFVIQNNTCSRSVDLNFINNLVSVAYDPNLATMYICYDEGLNIGLATFNTEKNEVIKSPLDGILYDIEVAY